MKCKSDDTSVIDSRIVEEGKAIRRRRKCEVCDHRFTTYERPEFATFTVIKAGGKKEPYSRDKLQRGIMVAAHKRPISSGQIETMISSLEEKWAANKKEISTKRIGRDVMESLKMLDEVAYLRFASVYLDYPCADEFLEEINNLIGHRKHRKKSSRQSIDQKELFEK
ncbi:MAG: transcriptional regulator NrdR [Patescibacteria group bacterium]|nr:transcriptional regulator NrdR [Patescibacteria group bacterium]